MTDHYETIEVVEIGSAQDVILGEKFIAELDSETGTEPNRLVAMADSEE
jgi:hypothetical protein